MKLFGILIAGALVAPGFAAAMDQGFGGHVGVNAGSSFSGSAKSGGFAATNGGYWASQDTPVVSSAVRKNLNPKGADLGLEAGVHYRSGDWVPGLIFSYGMHNVRASFASHVPYPTNAAGFDVSGAVRSSWLMTLRPRVGVVMGDFLFDVSAGLALTRLQVSQAFRDVNLMSERAEASQIKAGLALGAAAQYSLDRNWALKLDYLHTRFGKISATGNLVAANGAQNASQITQAYGLSSHTVRLGAVYNF